MENIWLVLAVAGATYLTRVIGFGLSKRTIPPAVDRFLGYVPVAAFAALIVPGINPGTPDLLPRILGLLVAVLITLRRPTLWAGLATGMATFWLAAWAFTGGPG